MERGICNICQKFFVKMQRNQEICDICNERDIEDFNTVKNYLCTHKQASIMEIYLDTKVPIKTLKRYIDEGKIHITNK